ncbi:hypothetical protein B5X24_HaOG214065, partial [Helicoverpa armigera]
MCSARAECDNVFACHLEREAEADFTTPASTNIILIDFVLRPAHRPPSTTCQIQVELLFRPGRVTWSHQ